MNIGDKLKNLFSVSEEEYYDDMDIDETERTEEEPVRETRNSSFGFNRSHSEPESNVVDMHSAPHASAQNGVSRAKIKIFKIDKFDDVAAIAQQVNDKKIVVLNLETCPGDVSVRIIDFLSGVSFANSGEIKRIAGKVYIITPYNVPLSGEMLDGFDQQSY